MTQTYFDDPNRIHKYEEESFYPQYALDFMKNLEHKGYKKTVKDDTEMDEFFGLKTIHNLFDYFKVTPY